MKEVIRHLGKEVRKGASFSRALRSRPDVFEELFVVTAEVGQESGRLAEVLSHLARHLEKMNSLKKKVLQALTYPALVLCVAFFAVLFLLVFIVPTFAEMFKSFQVDLPPTTRLVLRVSGLLTANGYSIGLMLLAVIFLLAKAVSSSGFRKKAEAFGLRTPLFGAMVLKNHVARFCRTLGTLLQAQVPLVDALGVSQRISTVDSIKEEIGVILRHVKKGHAVAEPMVGSKIFPPLVAQMITVGEETSELDSMLLKVADYYEQELDARIDALSSIIEPVIILLLGMLIGLILISMYLPMFELMNVVGGV
jgi:type IV pilus assembly protein PilC